MKNLPLVQNRKAHFNYELLETFEAGMILLGSEIKSLRNHGGSLQDAYIDIRGQDVFLINASIAPYSHGGAFNHEERRPRKLLLHKKEIADLTRKTQEKGLAMIPLSIYLNKKGIAKLRFAIGKGKKTHDKRAALREKEDQKTIKEYG